MDYKVYTKQLLHVYNFVQFTISGAKCFMSFIVFYVYFFGFCFTVILRSFGVTGVMQNIAHYLQLAGTSLHLGKIRCNNKKHV